MLWIFTVSSGIFISFPVGEINPASYYRQKRYLETRFSQRWLGSFLCAVNDWFTNPFHYLRPFSRDVFRWAVDLIAISLQRRDFWLRFNTQCFINKCIPIIFGYFLAAQNSPLLKAFSTRQGTGLPGSDIPPVNYIQRTFEAHNKTRSVLCLFLSN